MADARPQRAVTQTRCDDRRAPRYPTETGRLASARSAEPALLADRRRVHRSAARVVVIGGGVGGASVAYHLAELGERDVCSLERAELTSGSTFHSAGPGRPAARRPDADPDEHVLGGALPPAAGRRPPAGWTESGGIKLASSPERLEEIRRQISWARTYDLPLHEISPREVGGAFPLVDLAGVVGAAYLSRTATSTRRSCATRSLPAPAPGRPVRPAHRVARDRRAGGRVRGVRTDRGDIECEVVVDCGGMFAAEIGRLAGVRVPSSRWRTSTWSPSRSARGYRAAAAEPARSRPARLLPAGGRRAGDGRVRARPGAVDGDGGELDAIPADFNGRLLAEDWSRFEEIAANAQRRVPVLAETRDPADDQRPGGVHAGQRVLPRGDRGRRASSSPPASARTGSPAPAASAR